MRANDDRWDVVVVGLRDPSHAGVMVATAEVVHYASLPREAVEHAFANGEELEVMANLDRSEAERAAHELHSVGVVVDLRLASSHRDVMPVFKPDAERSIGLAVGGFIDDSATPPSVAETNAAPPEVEPDPESVRIPRVRTPTPASAHGGLSVTLGSGAGNTMPVSERPVKTQGLHSDPLDRLPMESGEQDVLSLGGPPAVEIPSSRSHKTPAPGSVRSDDVHPGSYGLVRDRDGLRGLRGGEPFRQQPASRPVPRAQPTRRHRTPSRPVPAPSGLSEPPRAQPASRNRPPSNAPRSEHGAGAAHPSGHPSGHSGSSGGRAARNTPVPAKPRSGPEPIGLAPMLDDAPVLPSVAPRASSRPQATAPSGPPGRSEPAALQLDFEAAGMTPRSKLSSAASVPHDDAPAPQRSRASQMGGTGESAAGRAAPPGLLELLGNDRVAWTLLAMSVALVISLITAISVRRGDIRDTLPPLEDELAAALNDPEGVTAGEKRSPAEIENEINDVLDDLERSFLMLWLISGVPMGLAFSRYRFK